MFFKPRLESKSVKFIGKQSRKCHVNVICLFSERGIFIFTQMWSVSMFRLWLTMTGYDWVSLDNHTINLTWMSVCVCGCACGWGVSNGWNCCRHYTLASCVICVAMTMAFTHQAPNAAMCATTSLWMGHTHSNIKLPRPMNTNKANQIPLISWNVHLMDWKVKSNRFQ